MKRLAFVTAASIALLPSAHAIDVTISPAELTQMASQLTTMKAELQQAQQQYVALTGSSHIGSMLGRYLAPPGKPAVELEPSVCGRHE